MRFLTKYDVRLESLRAQDESALNHLLQARIPHSVDDSLAEGARVIAERMESLAAAVTEVDPTLQGAVRATTGRMQDDLKKLHDKIVQAVKRKDETLRRQFKHLQAQAFPGGQPQERAVGFVYFLNKYGPALIASYLPFVLAFGERGIYVNHLVLLVALLVVMMWWARRRLGPSST